MVFIPKKPMLWLPKDHRAYEDEMMLQQMGDHKTRRWMPGYPCRILCCTCTSVCKYGIAPPILEITVEGVTEDTAAQEQNKLYECNCVNGTFHLWSEEAYWYDNPGKWDELLQFSIGPYSRCHWACGEMSCSNYFVEANPEQAGCWVATLIGPTHDGENCAARNYELWIYYAGKQETLTCGDYDNLDCYPCGANSNCFIKDFGNDPDNKPDCTAWDELVVPQTGSGTSFGCDFSNATVIVTSLKESNESICRAEVFEGVGNPELGGDPDIDYTDCWCASTCDCNRPIPQEYSVTFTGLDEDCACYAWLNAGMVVARESSPDCYWIYTEPGKAPNDVECGPIPGNESCYRIRLRFIKGNPGYIQLACWLSGGDNHCYDWRITPKSNWPVNCTEPIEIPWFGNVYCGSGETCDLSGSVATITPVPE